MRFEGKAYNSFKNGDIVKRRAQGNVSEEFYKKFYEYNYRVSKATKEGCNFNLIGGDYSTGFCRAKYGNGVFELAPEHEQKPLGICNKDFTLALKDIL